MQGLVRDIVSVYGLPYEADVDSLPDEELPWAYIMYPVTAGTGSRGSSASYKYNSR